MPLSLALCSFSHISIVSITDHGKDGKAQRQGMLALCWAFFRASPGPWMGIEPEAQGTREPSRDDRTVLTGEEKDPNALGQYP